MMATHKVETEKHADVMIASKVCKKKAFLRAAYIITRQLQQFRAQIYFLHIVQHAFIMQNIQFYCKRNTNFKHDCIERPQHIANLLSNFYQRNSQLLLILYTIFEHASED